MKKTLLAAILFSILSFAAAPAQVGFYEYLSSAVVQLDWILHGFIETGGNGFILCDKDWKIGVTAWHVATDSEYSPIATLNRSQFGSKRESTRVLYHDNKADIAFFRAKEDDACLYLSGEDPQAGQEVFYITALGAAYRDSGTLEMKIRWSHMFFESGLVTHCCDSYAELAGPVRERWSYLAHASLPSAKGTSGSPIFDLQGRVVGVLVGGFSTIDTLFVPRKSIIEALDRARTNGVRP